MENVVAATVPVNFVLEDVLRLWPAEDIAQLRAAFPCIREYDRSDFQCHAVPSKKLGVTFPSYTGLEAQDVDITIHLRTSNMNVLCPQAGRMLTFGVIQQFPEGQALLDTLNAVGAVAADFGIVNSVILWLDERIDGNMFTLGEVAYLAPWLTSLLPAAHPIHQMAGRRGPATGVPSVWQAKMRRCAEIVVSGSLAPKAERKLNFKVAFSGPDVCTREVGLL